MIGERCYQIYNSILLHYKGDYDCFKYNFKTKVKEGSLNSHKFKWQFIGLEKESIQYNNPDDFLKIYFFHLYNQYQYKYFTNPVNKGIINHMDEYISNIKKYYLNISIDNFYFDKHNIHELYPDGYSLMKSKELSFDEFVLTELKHHYVDIKASDDIVTWKSVVDKVNKNKGFLSLIVNSNLNKITR